MNAETEKRYLPVLLISEKKSSEISEIEKKNVIEADTNVQEKSDISIIENDATSEEMLKSEFTGKSVYEEESTNDDLDENPEILSTDTVKSDDLDTEMSVPEVENSDDVSSDEKSTDESTTILEDDDRYDLYEKEYGNIAMPKFQKIKKKPKAEKDLAKKENAEKQKPTTFKATSQSDTINHHFEMNGFLVVESSKPQSIAGLKNITYLIAENYKFTAPLLKEIRKSICKPNAKGDRTFCFEFEKKEGSFYNEFCSKMKQYGLFSKYSINVNILTGTIASVPRIISFLNGQWLELYIAYITEEIVRDFSKSNGYEYEILMNVKVASITSVSKYAHEIDSTFSIGSECFALEAKSGAAFDEYYTLYNTRKELRFVPDRYLLLSTSLEDPEVAQTLQYFYEFFITGIETFRESLLTMINKAFA